MSCFSVALIKCLMKKKCKEGRTYLAYSFRGDKVHHAVEGMATGRGRCGSKNGKLATQISTHTQETRRENTKRGQDSKHKLKALPDLTQWLTLQQSSSDLP